MTDATTTRPALIDHLVYAVPDLDTGIAAVQEQIGATLSPGGHHQRWGTRNALLGLGAGCYLEVIGPDPDVPSRTGEPRPFGIDDLTRPRLATWCAAPPDLEAGIQAVRDVGYDPGQPLEMSRRTPGGSLLVWRLAMSDDPLPGGGILPFLIDWGTTPHPSQSAPSAVTLARLSAEHPDLPTIRPVLEALGVDLHVVHGPVPTLVAVLDTPVGRVELR